jgi:signal transduction histidine kinase/CheY-like chemotaxis protein
MAQKTLRDATQTVRALTWLSLILPAVIFALAAASSYKAHFADARERAERTVEVVREHANRTFDIPQVARFSIGEVLRGLTEEEIAARERELSARVNAFASAYPQLDDIWVFNAAGRPLVSAKTYPVPKNIDYTDRDYYRVFKDGAVPLSGVYISKVLRGRARPVIFFQVTFARVTDDGVFDGVIGVSVNPKYYLNFFEQISKIGINAMAIVRSDGHVLARHPNSLEELLSLPVAKEFAASVRENPQEGFYRSVSSVDGNDRSVAYRQVGSYPVYAAVGIDRDNVIAAWRGQLGEWVLIGAPSTAVIFFLCLLAGRHVRQEQEALARLSAEMQRREEAEEQVRQLQKMEAIGQLTGGIAHDFNNLLTIIIGCLDMMNRRMARGETKVQPFVDGAMDGAKRAATLIAQLLAFARRQPLDPKPADLNRVIANMSGLLERTLGEQVQVETVQAAGLWLTNIDVNQFESAVINLAVNARDAMPDGGKLTIETANTYLDEHYASQNVDVTPGQYVVICVTDTGGGMAPDVAAKAFEPFFTTKQTGRGTGLGLSQVYGFVKQSKGHIKIYTELGHGTTIKLYMPRHHDPFATLPSAPIAPASTGGKETILLAEDEDGVRNYVKMGLEELGYHVLEADGPYAALSILETGQHIDLLLTDIVMPGMNGRELSIAAEKLRPGLKVLFTTGYSRNAVIHNGVLDPGVALLNKPFSLQQLGAKVRAVLDA